jgi:hypothetical protein
VSVQKNCSTLTRLDLMKGVSSRKGVVCNANQKLGREEEANAIRV